MIGHWPVNLISSPLPSLLVRGVGLVGSPGNQPHSKGFSEVTLLTSTLVWLKGLLWISRHVYCCYHLVNSSGFRTSVPEIEGGANFFIVLTLFFLFKKNFIVIQLQLYAFSPHPSTPPQLNPPPSPTSTLPLDFVHVSFIVVPVIPSPHCSLPTPPWPLLFLIINHNITPPYIQVSNTQLTNQLADWIANSQCHWLTTQLTDWKNSLDWHSDWVSPHLNGLIE